jgi:glycosyltransferase involved in cell wall biosynthesis
MQQEMSARASGTLRRPYKLAVLASHVIQYQAPFFRYLAASGEIEPTVFFCLDWGAQAYHDKQFGRTVRWDVPLLEGYRFEHLPNWSPRPGVEFWGQINPGIASRLRAGAFDAVLVFGWAHATNWIAMSAAFFSGLPVLMSGESYLLLPQTGRKRLAKRLLFGALFPRIKAFMAIGRHNADFYRAYGVPQRKIFPLPYAVNNDFFFSQAREHSSRRLESRRELGLPPDMPVILSVCKLMDKKRPLDLLAAYERVSKRRPAALVFVGNGDMERELALYAERKGLSGVRFVGFQNQTELGRFYSLADVFVLPSSYETWGLVVNEAMCFGLPVVASDRVGATGDLVRDGVNGFVFPVGDVGALSEKLEALLSDEGRRRAMGEASLRIIRDWSYREGAQGLRACLEEIVRS